MASLCIFPRSRCAICRSQIRYDASSASVRRIISSMRCAATTFALLAPRRFVVLAYVFPHPLVVPYWRWRPRLALRTHLEPFFGVTPSQHVDALLRHDGITPTPTTNLSTVLNLFMPTAPATGQGGHEVYPGHRRGRPSPVVTVHGPRHHRGLQMHPRRVGRRCLKNQRMPTPSPTRSEAESMRWQATFRIMRNGMYPKCHQAATGSDRGDARTAVDVLSAWQVPAGTIRKTSSAY